MHDIALSVTAMSLKTPTTNERISRIRSLRPAIINFSIGCLVALLCFSAREAHGQANQITELIENLKLVEKLKSLDLEERRAATIKLGRVAAEANETIQRLTTESNKDNKDYSARVDAARDLGQVGARVKNAVPALIEALDDDANDEYVRYGVAYALGELGKKAMPAVPKLIKALENKSKFVRGAAAIALGKIREDATEVTRALTAMLKDTDPSVCSDVLIALGAYGEEAEEAVPAIKAKLRDAVIDTRIRAASALGNIGPAAQGSVSELAEVLKNATDAVLRRYVASALGKIGTEEAITSLIDALSDRNKDVCSEAALALGDVGKKAKEAVPKLIGALTDRDESVRSAAAFALGKIAVEAADAKTVVIPLISALKDEKPDVRKDVADALCSIAEAVSDAKRKEMVPQLEDAHKAVKEHRNLNEQARVIKQTIDHLKSVPRPGLLEPIAQPIRDYPVLSSVIGLYLFQLTCWLLLFGLRPLWLLRVSTFLYPYKVTIDKLGGITLDVRVFLLISLFHFRLRVLDALVQKHLGKAKENIKNRVPNRQKQLYVPTPAMIDEEMWDGISAVPLQLIFNKSRVIVLITGVGEVGKTSLACQMALWAMDEGEEMRLCNHQMLPVLIKADSKRPRLDSKKAFIKAISGELHLMIDRLKEISEELLMQLLLQRRVLVIVDGLSESDDATRNSIHPAQDDFFVNALVVTSRSGEEVERMGGTTIELRLSEKTSPEAHLENEIVGTASESPSSNSQ